MENKQTKRISPKAEVRRGRYLTMRVGDAMLTALDAIAAAQGVARAVVVREALAAHVAAVAVAHEAQGVRDV